MSLFKIRLGEARAARKTAKTPKFSEKNMEGQVRARLLGAYFREMPADEAARFGRSLMTRLLGDTADPEAALKAELFESDEEFKREYRDLLLEEKRRKVEGLSKRGRGRYDDDDDRAYDPFNEFGRELLIEMIEKGRRGGGIGESLINSLGQLLPALMAMNGGMQPAPANAVAVGYPDQLPPGMPADPAHQMPPPPPPPVSVNTPEEGNEMPAIGRKLLDLFTAADVQQLLAITDIQEAGRQAAGKIGDAINAAPPHKRAEMLMGLQTALEAPAQFLLIYLGGFKGDPAWAPVVRYLEQHKDHLSGLQQAIAQAMSDQAGAPADDDPDGHEGDE